MALALAHVSLSARTRYKCRCNLSKSSSRPRARVRIRTNACTNITFSPREGGIAIVSITLHGLHHTSSYRGGRGGTPALAPVAAPAADTGAGGAAISRAKKACALGLGGTTAVPATDPTGAVAVALLRVAPPPLLEDAAAVVVAVGAVATPTLTTAAAAAAGNATPTPAAPPPIVSLGPNEARRCTPADAMLNADGAPVAGDGPAAARADGAAWAPPLPSVPGSLVPLLPTMEPVGVDAAMVPAATAPRLGLLSRMEGRPDITTPVEDLVVTSPPPFPSESRPGRGEGGVSSRGCCPTPAGDGEKSES